MDDMDIPESLRRTKPAKDDGYDAEKNGREGYALAVGEMRKRVVGERSVLAIPGDVTATGLDLPDGLTFAEWLDVGEQLKNAERSLMWWIGDWLRFGEQKYGEMYAQAIDATAKNYQTIADAKWVAISYEFSDRSENLSWTHHRFAASIKDKDKRQRLLTLAAENSWPVRELRKRISQMQATARLLLAQTDADCCTVADLWGLVEQGKKFGCIYADPPWKYDNQGTRAATGMHYRGVEDENGDEVQSASGMTVEEICALPIKELAAGASHLHLWITNAFLFEAPRIFDAWGFEWRSSFVWVKPQIGIGNYWRNSHEFLLTAIRGDAKRFNDKSLKSWLECDRGQHSGKPEQVRSFVERASPGPYLELFGRRSAESISSADPKTKWVVWGNQIERSIFDAAVREVA
jgi:N6-adenosine-specific RNA methylase IME4